MIIYLVSKIINIIQRYITGDLMLKSSYIFPVVISSLFISDVYGLIAPGI